MKTTKRGHVFWTLLCGALFIVSVIVTVASRGHVFLLFGGLVNLIGCTLNLRAWAMWSDE